MIERILEIGSRIATPMALAGFCAAALFGGAWLILKKVPKLNREGSISVIFLIVKSLFWLSVVTAVLALIGYIAGLQLKSAGNAAPLPEIALRSPKRAVPNLPYIRIETLGGLPEGTSNNPHLRLNRLVIRNANEVELFDFCSRLQFPEPIATTIETNKTTGTVIGWRPLLDKLSISGTGGRTEGGLWLGPTSAVHFIETYPCFAYPGKPRGQAVSVSRAGDITGVWELTIDKLPPSGFVDILFLTSNGPDAAHYTGFASVPLWQSPPDPQPNPDTNELRFSLEGEYRFEAATSQEKNYFLVPINFDSKARRASSLGMLADVGHWHPVILTYQ